MLEFYQAWAECYLRSIRDPDPVAMHSYASWTGTKRNLRAMRNHGWRLLMSPDTWDRNGRRTPTWADGTPAPYAIDNGAWGAFNQRTKWDPGRFQATYDALGESADWTVVPDIVEGGLASLAISESWLPRLAGRLLLPVQDGMVAQDVRPLIGGRVGLFIGGSTEWKLHTLSMWGRVAVDANCWLHVGRVNSMRRIAMCATAGAHSFDGTSITRYAVNIGKLDTARHKFAQAHLNVPWDIPPSRLTPHLQHRNES